MPAPLFDGDGDRTVVKRDWGQPRLGVGAGLINGTYVIEALLGDGGMGVVYKARHADHSNDCSAIKIIRPELANDEKILKAFIIEADALKRVKSDAIVHYEGFLRDERGNRCLIMEFVEGTALGEVLRQRRFDTSEVLTLLERIGTGLADAHAHKVIHRDISPDNILLPGGEIARAKLIDFGIAKFVDTGDHTLFGNEFVGKYAFASPEQVGLFGGVVDARSDIYSLGLVLAAAALGFGRKLDMDGTTARVIGARQTVPDLSALPATLQPLIRHTLQPLPDNRPASVRVLLEEAAKPRRGSRGAPIADPPRRQRDRSLTRAPAPAARTDPPAAGKPPRSRTLPMIVGGAVLAAGLLFGGIVLALRLLLPSVEELRSELAVAASGYRCAELAYSVDPDRNVSVSGFVSSDEDLSRLRQAIAGMGGVTKLDFNVRRRIWPYCEIVSLLKPHFAKGNQAPEMTVLTPAAERRVDHKLALEVRAPDTDSYVYIDYFKPSGEVVHLFPNGTTPIALRPALNRFVLGRGPMRECWNFASQPGEQLITVIASPRSLFSGPVPKAEGAREYLGRLSDVLARPSVQARAAALFFDVLADGPTNAAEDRCPRG